MIGLEGKTNALSGIGKSRSPGYYYHLLLVPALLAPALLGQTVSPPEAPSTVEQSIFRSRWIGPQYDQPTPTPLPTPVPAVTTETGAESAATAGASSSPPVSIPSSWDSHLGDGFNLGPIQVIPTLSIGWEYSDENNSGYRKDESSNSSFFIAPGAALDYEREVGAWSLSAKYAAAYVYYTDDNFSPYGGGGNNSNKLQQTAMLSVGVTGSRYHATLDLSGSQGTGFDTEVGQNNDQRTWAVNFDGFYQVTEWVSFDTEFHYDGRENSNANTAPDSDRYTVYANFGVNQSWSGKTSFRYESRVGRSSQSIQNDPNAERQYVQVLAGINHTPNDKWAISVLAGGRYVEEPKTSRARDSGLQPAYNVKVTYKPTDKLSFYVGSSLDQTDVDPNYRFVATWQPRDTTVVRLSVYQQQGYSGSYSSQIRIQRGVSLSAVQKLFTTVNTTLEVGYEESEYDRQGDDDDYLDDSATKPDDYTFVSLQVDWQIRHWLAFRTGYWLRSHSNSYDSSPGTRITISLDATF